MNILYPAGAKREWFDRNGVTGGGQYNTTGIIPHSETARVSYTVPANKKAFVCGMSGLVYRAIAATTPGLYTIEFFCGHGINNYELGWLMDNSNTVGVNKSMIIPSGIVLMPQDTLTIYTSDLSTGGQLGFFIGATWIEFDA